MLNEKKTKYMWICFRDVIVKRPPLTIGNDTITRVSSFRQLGVLHQGNLKWDWLIEEITKKARRRLFLTEQ